MLRTFVTDWNRTRPKTSGRFQSADKRSDVNPIGAVEWLVEETRCSGACVGSETIRRIMRGSVDVVALGVADALAVAISRPEAFYDGTLEVRSAPERPALNTKSLNGGTPDHGRSRGF